MDYEEFREAAVEVIGFAGCILEGYYKQSREKLGIEYKGVKDIVGMADKESQTDILERLKQKFPDHNYISEEGHLEDNGSDYTWVIDPLDGTFFFSAGIPLFSVSIGLLYKGRPVVGVVHAPILKETYVAEKGWGAYLNDKKICVSGQNKLERANITTEFTTENTAPGLALTSKLSENVLFVRTFACEALDMCWVASGGTDANVSYGSEIWDITAGSVILEEAGGKITDFKGDPIDYTKVKIPSVVSSNRTLHDSIIAITKEENL